MSSSSSLSRIPAFLFFSYVLIVSVNVLRLCFPAKCAREKNQRGNICVEPSLTEGDTFALKVLVTKERNERKVMEDYFRQKNAFEEELESDDRKSFREQLGEDLGAVFLEGAKIVSAYENERQIWGTKETVDLEIPLLEFGARDGNGMMLYAHVFFTAARSADDDGGGSSSFRKILAEEDILLWESVPLIKYLKVGQARKKQKLLTSSSSSSNSSSSAVKNEEEEEEELNSKATTTTTQAVHLVPHLRPHVRILKVKKPFPFFARGAPMDIGIQLLSLNKRTYRPLATIDDVSISKREWRQLKLNSKNKNNTEAEEEKEEAVIANPIIKLHLQPLPVGIYRMIRNMAMTLDQLSTTMGFTEEDLDEVREMVVGQDWRWLVATFVVGLMHSWFSFLAFKNDVGFWKGRTNVEGLSVRSQWSNFVCSTIIFLNIWESRGTASSIIVVETGIAALLEFWKCWKFITAKRARVKNNEETSEMQKNTDDADAKAMKWLVFAVFPCVIALSARSLLVDEHRSWKSWFLRNAANGVYIFGFVAMTPQLYINYKLKSVAHLPWRAFMYKTFNTFIDDVFSFAVAMPWQHRIACLRDDVIFFGYLYQRWLYGVDKSRVNEFGRAYEDDGVDDDSSTIKENDDEKKDDETETKKDR
jgi:hypothetical protein